MRIGTEIYVVGGQTNGSTYIASVERTTINPDGSLANWQFTTPLSIARGGIGVVAVGDYLYIAGVYSDTGSLSIVERSPINLDGSLASWQPLPSLQFAPPYATALSARGYLYVVEGLTSSGIVRIERAVVKRDGGLESWQTASEFASFYGVFEAAAGDPYVYVVGRYGSGDGRAFRVKVVTGSPLRTLVWALLALAGFALVWEGWRSTEAGKGAIDSVVILPLLVSETAFPHSKGCHLGEDNPLRWPRRSPQEVVPVALRVFWFGPGSRDNPPPLMPPSRPLRDTRSLAT